jgi:hypothetical protein
MTLTPSAEPPLSDVYIRDRLDNLRLGSSIGVDGELADDITGPGTAAAPARIVWLRHGMLT